MEICSLSPTAISIKLHRARISTTALQSLTQETIVLEIARVAGLAFVQPNPALVQQGLPFGRKLEPRLRSIVSFNIVESDQVKNVAEMFGSQVDSASSCYVTHDRDLLVCAHARPYNTLAFQRPGSRAVPRTKGQVGGSVEAEAQHLHFVQVTDEKGEEIVAVNQGHFCLLRLHKTPPVPLLSPTTCRRTAAWTRAACRKRACQRMGCQTEHEQGGHVEGRHVQGRNDEEGQHEQVILLGKKLEAASVGGFISLCRVKMTCRFRVLRTPLFLV